MIEPEAEHLFEVTVDIQDVGNVGFYFAQIAERELGVRVVAVANSRKMVVDHEGVSFVNTTFLRGAIDELGFAAGESDDIISVDCDVLVLAALGEVINDDNQAAIEIAARIAIKTITISNSNCWRI